MRERLQRWMYGRYGQDDLNRFLSIFTLLLCVVSLFVQWPILSGLLALLLGWMLFRMFSRNGAARAKENHAFLKVKNRALRPFRRMRKHFAQRKTHRFFRCPQCKQELRVPVGKGSITITCPKCQTKFEKKT